MDIFTNGFLIILLPLLGVFIFIRLGWQAGVRFFGLLVLPLFFIVGIAIYFVISLPSNSIRVLGIGIVSVLYLYLIIRFIVFYLNRRNAGKLILSDSKPFPSILITVIVVCFLMGLMLFIPLLFGTHGNHLDLQGVLWLSFVALALIQKMNSFEIRENGMLVGWKFLAWKNIDSIQWTHLLRKEKLNIRVKGLDKITQVKVPWDQHLAIAEFIKQKYPS